MDAVTLGQRCHNPRVRCMPFPVAELLTGEAPDRRSAAVIAYPLAPSDSCRGDAELLGLAGQHGGVGWD